MCGGLNFPTLHLQTLKGLAKSKICTTPFVNTITSLFIPEGSLPHVTLHISAAHTLRSFWGYGGDTNRRFVSKSPPTTLNQRFVLFVMCWSYPEGVCRCMGFAVLTNNEVIVSTIILTSGYFH